jgi:hypothetical protein
MVLIPRRSTMRMSSGTKEQRRNRGTGSRGKRDRLERKHTREYMDMLAIFRKAKVSLA